MTIQKELVRDQAGNLAATLERLTEREAEVLALLANGHTNRAISDLLSLTERTVETHVSRIFCKLDLGASTAIHRRVRAALVHQRASQEAR